MGQILIVTNSKELNEHLRMKLPQKYGVEVIISNSSVEAKSFYEILPEINIILCSEVIGKDQTAAKICEYLAEKEKEDPRKVQVAVLGKKTLDYPFVTNLGENILNNKIILYLGFLLGQEERNILIEEEAIEKEREELERIEREKQQKLQQEADERERQARERYELEKIQKEKEEKDRIEKEKEDKKRALEERIQRGNERQIKLKQERLEKEQLEKDQAEKERIQLEKLRLEKERLELERQAKELLLKERLEREKLEKERLDSERLLKEQAERDKRESEKAERERITFEIANKEKIEREKKEKEQAELLKAQKEQEMRERIERGKARIASVAKERAEAEKAEKERLAKEQVQKQQDEIEKEQLRERDAREKIQRGKDKLSQTLRDKGNEEKKLPESSISPVEESDNDNEKTTVFRMPNLDKPTSLDVSEPKVISEYLSISVIYFEYLSDVTFDFNAYSRIKKGGGFEYNVKIPSKTKLASTELERILARCGKELYITQEDLITSSVFLNPRFLNRFKKEGMTLADRMKLNSDSFEILLHIFKNNSFDKNNIEIIKELIKSVAVTVKLSSNLTAIQKVIKSDGLSYGYSHLYLTYYILSQVIDKFPWSKDQSKNKILYLALFHDLTLQSDRLIKLHHRYATEKDKLSPEDNQIILNHAHSSAAVLETIVKAPVELTSIVKEHHGMKNGKGLPESLSYSTSPLMMGHIVVEDFVTYFLEAISKCDNENLLKEKLQEIFGELKKKYQKLAYLDVLNELEVFIKKP